MKTRRVVVRSLAKINLDLRVLNKRPDGFHELRTVFQTISLADTIEIEYEPARRTQLRLAGNVNIPDNLILRASEAVLDAMRVHATVRFTLTKRIPMGAGLGGGSSNAAAVLLALPALAGTRSLTVAPHERPRHAGTRSLTVAPHERTKHKVSVEKIAAELGSDVPFFLAGGTVLGVGRGTEFYPLPDLAEDPILVVAPDIHAATGAAYAALDRSLTFAGTSSSINSFQAYVRAIVVARRAGPASALSGNDFEAVAFRQHPELPAILRRLSKAGAVGARMTGSGSSIFAIFESVAERARARKTLDGDRALSGCRMMDARLVSRRRYRQMWQRQLGGITG